MSPQPVPPLAERNKPGLSATLPYPRELTTCQRCGLIADPSDGVALEIWEECDEWDREQRPPVYVILCRACSSKVINPHPRMYHKREWFAPNLGAMGICVGCLLNSVLGCGSPLAKQNGGPGMEVKYRTAPVHAHVRGTGFSGFKWLFSGPAISCAGREELCSLCGAAKSSIDHEGHGIGECVDVCDVCLADDSSGVKCDNCDGRGWLPFPQAAP